MQQYKISWANNRVTTVIQAAVFVRQLSKLTGCSVSVCIEWVRKNKGFHITMEEYKRFKDYVPTWEVVCSQGEKQKKTEEEIRKEREEEVFSRLFSGL
jgi:hypothetical protein